MAKFRIEFDTEKEHGPVFVSYFRGDEETLVGGIQKLTMGAVAEPEGTKARLKLVYVTHGVLNSPTELQKVAEELSAVGVEVEFTETTAQEAALNPPSLD